MNLVSRVKGILFDTEQEWRKIEREPEEQAPLFLNYVAILALIPAITGFVGKSVIGVAVSAGSFRVPVIAGLLDAVITYLFSFVIVYVTAMAVDALAPAFRADRYFPAALKLAVYSFTPVWLAGIFLILPGTKFLTVFGLYGVYLLWAGLPVMMRCPRNRTLPYALSCAAAAFSVILALSFLQAAVTRGF